MMKPPIGIVPEIIWKQDRFIELGQAIQRRIEHTLKIPAEWVEEYNRLDEEVHLLGRSK
jgi:hypothetical protein